MDETSHWRPVGAAPEPEHSGDGNDPPAGTVILIESALAGPEPPPDAESQARERALNQFREGDLAPNALRPAPDAPSPPSWRDRLFRRWGRKP